MEKAVTALFNQLLLLFSIMQGINAEPLTRNLDQLNKGSHPFVIPNKGYDEEKGLLPDLCKIEYYQSFEIL